MRRAILAGTSMLTLLTSPVLAQTPVAAPVATMTKEQVQGIVKEYLMSNPEVVIDALNAYQEKRAKEATAKSKEVIEKKASELLYDKKLPSAGAKDADIVIAEFFDYHCGYCKHMLPVITELLETDKKVRVVFHEFPILSEESVMAAKAALAVSSIKPEKYFEYHTALMKINGKYTEADLLAEAKKLGISEKDFQAALSNPDIVKQIEKTQSLAKEIGITGTPALIIGKEFIPGAASIDTIKQMIEAQRKGASGTPTAK